MFLLQPLRQFLQFRFALSRFQLEGRLHTRLNLILPVIRQIAHHIFPLMIPASLYGILTVKHTFMDRRMLQMAPKPFDQIQIRSIGGIPDNR